MKRLPTSGFRPAIITFFSLLLLLGCEKDGFAPFDTPDEIGDYSPSVNYPISIWEAMTYYGHLNSFPPHPLNGNDTTSFRLVSMEPAWEQAFIGHSQSGKEIVIVPVPDEWLTNHNQGRSGARLLFSKINNDSISARLLVYLADTAYHQANNGVLDFNTFTGLYIFFDIGQHFVNGLRMHNGAPVGEVKSVFKAGGTSALDRNEGCDCIVHFDIILACQVFAFTNCDYSNVVVESEVCDCSGGGGAASGSGSGSGGSGGGGSGGGGGTGGSGGGPTQLTYSALLGVLTQQMHPE